MARYEFAEVVLRQEVDGEAVFEDRDVRMFAHGAYERPFDFGAREIFVVEDAVFGMTALAVEFEAAVGRLVEAGAPCDQIADPLGRMAHDQLYGFAVALAGAADHRIPYVLFEGIRRISYRADAALCVVGVALVHLAFRYDGYAPVCGGFQGETQPRGAGAYHQKIGFHTLKMIVL